MKIRTAAVAVVATLVLAGAAQAAPTVNVKFLGTGAGQNVRLTYKNNTLNVFAGQLRHELSNASAGYGWINGQHRTYCSDLDQYVTSTAKNYTIADVSALPGAAPMGNAKADLIRALYAFSAGQEISTSAANDYATAFQLAVWEIVTDGTPVNSVSGSLLTGGQFQARTTGNNTLSSSIVTKFTSLMNGALSMFNPSSGNDDVLGVTSGTYQDQLLVVPAPGPLALAALGCFAIARRRREIKN